MYITPFWESPASYAIVILRDIQKKKIPVWILDRLSCCSPNGALGQQGPVTVRTHTAHPAASCVLTRLEAPSKVPSEDPKRWVMPLAPSVWAQSVYKELPLTTVSYWLHESLVTKRTNRHNHCKSIMEGPIMPEKMRVHVSKGKLQWCPRLPRGHRATVFTQTSPTSSTFITQIPCMAL